MAMEVKIFFLIFLMKVTSCWGCEECCNNCCGEDIKCGDKKEEEKMKNENKKGKRKNEREENWIKFLSGGKIQDDSFRFQSCEEFRNASDDDLEKYHDYIQVVFPNLEQSAYDNKDLYLNKDLKKWQKLMQNKESRLKIQKNLELNLVRILEFFKFIVKLDGNNKIINLVAEINSAVFQPGNHNRLRLTRVLKCLKIFGLDNEYKLIINSINSNEKITTKIKKNSTLKESYKHWVESKETNCLFTE